MKFHLPLTIGLMFMGAVAVSPNALAGSGGVAVGVGVKLNGYGNVEDFSAAAAVGKTSAFAFGGTVQKNTFDYYYYAEDYSNSTVAGALGTGAGFSAYTNTSGSSVSNNLYVSEESNSGKKVSQNNNLSNTNVIPQTLNSLGF